MSRSDSQNGAGKRPNEPRMMNATTETEPEVAGSASALYDPQTKAVMLDITTTDGDLISIELQPPELLQESLSHALRNRAEDIGAPL